MNWRKLNSKTVLAGILYVCIIPIFIFSLAYTAQRFATEPTETELTQESRLPRMVYRLRLAVLCFAGMMIVMFPLVLYKEYAVRRIDSESKAKRAIWLAKVSFGILLVMSVVCTALSVLSLLAIEAAQGESLRGALRVDLVWEAGVALLGISCLPDEIKLQRYFRRKSIPAIVADYHFGKHKEALADKNIDEANKALVRACEAAPFEVVPWATRAAFTAQYLSLPEEAEGYLERATENLEKNPRVSDEDRAWYEFYFGGIMLGKGEVEEAISRIERSIELQYHPGRAAYLEELRERYDYKSGLSNDEG